MDWFAALVTRANGDSGVTTALGGAKVYPETAPQSVPLPYVILTDRTPERLETFSGWDLEASRVQIDVHTLKYTDKQRIMEAVLSALLPGGTFSGHKFQRARIELGPWDAPVVQDGAVTVLTKQADLIIHHTPA